MAMALCGLDFLPLTAPWLKQVLRVSCYLLSGFCDTMAGDINPGHSSTHSLETWQPSTDGDGSQWINTSPCWSLGVGAQFWGTLCIFPQENMARWITTCPWWCSSWQHPYIGNPSLPVSLSLVSGTHFLNKLYAHYTLDPNVIILNANPFQNLSVHVCKTSRKQT